MRTRLPTHNTHTHLYIYICTYVYIYIYTLYIYIHAYIHMQIHIHVCFHKNLHRGVLKLSMSWFTWLTQIGGEDLRFYWHVGLVWKCRKKTPYLIVHHRFSWFFPYETAMVEGFSGRCFHRPEVTIKTVLKGPPKTGLTSDWLNITSQPHI